MLDFRVTVWLVWLSFFLTVAPGCADAVKVETAAVLEPPAEITTTNAAELYGLQVGAKWTFLRSNGPLRWKEITACEDVPVIDPTTGVRSIVRAYVRENRSETGTTSVHYLVQDSEGVKRVRRDDVDKGRLEMFATYVPSVPRLYDGPYASGLVWNFGVVTGEFSPEDDVPRGASETAAIDEVVAIEYLDVMAGRFATLTIGRQWDANNPHYVLSHYAPGVGEVREATEWPGDPLPEIQIEELVAYTPGYGSCDGSAALFDTPCDAPLAQCQHPWGNAVAGCTDPRVDAANCGACGTACESGVCAGGTCVTPDADVVCDGTTVACTNAWGQGLPACTSPSRDKWNCGACGNVCGEDLVCDHGECSCEPGTGECGAGACQDLLADEANCGECGNVCGGDTPNCDKGVCVGSCLSVSLTECGDTCVDLDWTSGHCGSCDNACGNGFGSTTCAAGSCITCDEAGLTDCGGDCEDVRWSDKNCGGCGITCSDIEVCVEGTCTTGDGSCTESCGDGDKICCGGSCIDPQTSDTFCGGCGGDQCEGGCTEACRDAECQPVDCGGGDD